MIIIICFIKTLLEKTLVKEKEYNILLDYNCPIKNLVSKTQKDKTCTKGKRVYHSDILIN